MYYHGFCISEQFPHYLHSIMNYESSKYCCPIPLLPPPLHIELKYVVCFTIDSRLPIHRIRGTEKYVRKIDQHWSRLKTENMLLRKKYKTAVRLLYLELMVELNYKFGWAQYVNILGNPNNFSTKFNSWYVRGTRVPDRSFLCRDKLVITNIPVAPGDMELVQSENLP